MTRDQGTRAKGSSGSGAANPLGTVCGTGGALAVHDGDRWREIDSGYAGDLIDLALQNFRQAIILADDGSLLGCTVLDP